MPKPMPKPVAMACTLSLAVLCLGPASPARSAEPSGADIADLQRAIAELKAQNRALAQRIETLEAERAGPAAARPPVAAPRAGSSANANANATATANPGTDEALARRVAELEFGKIAQEDATRAIIRDALAKQGSKVNETVSLGGALELQASRQRDFSGSRKSALQLGTAELDLELQTGDWATAKLVLAYTDGSNTLFTSTRGTDSAVDRLSVETASITLGNLQRFPLLLQAGRMSLAFGSSTGVHRSDTLAIDGPLTTDAFQLRRTAVGVGFGLPTPQPAPPARPVVVPPVKPLWLGPLVGRFAQALGYMPPPTRPRPATPVSAPVDPPPFYGNLYLYDGAPAGTARSFLRNVNARLGYRAGGHCGKRFTELRAADLCPWSLDLNIDHVSSVFDSGFLAHEYATFLDRIGPVRGMATTAKLTLGPVLMVAEWNGAVASATFVDDAGRSQRLKPAAWAASVGYQFDWNPWVESIGGQGSYVALGYSRSRDLAGVTQLVSGERQRVGALPQSRWTLTFGEWVQEGLKLQVEFSRTQDYPAAEGGTGASGNGIQMTLTYGW